MQVECINPLALTESDAAQWRALLAADPALTSPYLTPDWAQAVARRRSDARVAIYRHGNGRAAGFLAVQRPNNHAALPVGGPVCDYQAVAGSRLLDVSLAAKALRVGRIDFTAGLRENALAPYLHAEDAGHVARLDGGWDAYCAERQEAGSKVVGRARKKLSKLTREKPGVLFEPFSRDEAAFNQLIAWKREQMLRTGVTDIFEREWIDLLVRDCFHARLSDQHFGGAMFVMRVEGKPAAILFCLRAQRALHAWFVAHDPELAEYSPGQLLFVEAMKASAQAGFTEFDFGPGDYQFKESLSNWSRPVGAGFVGRAGFASALKAAQFQMRALVESLPVGRARQWPAKAMRRLDIERGLAPPQGKAA